MKNVAITSGQKLSLAVLVRAGAEGGPGGTAEAFTEANQIAALLGIGSSG
jgi:hypothetical protein